VGPFYAPISQANSQPKVGPNCAPITIRPVRRPNLALDRLRFRSPKQRRPQDLRVLDADPKQLPKKRRMMPTDGVMHVQNVLSQFTLL